MRKPAPTDVPIHDLIASRWSPRALDPERPVPPAARHAILEAARWAPSCFNEQPWRFLVFDASDPAALESARGCLAEGNAWARSAPLLLLSAARESFTRNGKPNPHARHDVGLATENLLLQAEALGLSGHAMAGFDAERARGQFGIPEGFAPVAMIAIGYALPAERLTESERVTEGSPRSRHPLGSVAFASRWDSPFRP